MSNISRIRERAELLRQLRQFFDQRGFLEVQPPCLSRDCVIDAYIDLKMENVTRLRMTTHPVEFDMYYSL